MDLDIRPRLRARLADELGDPRLAAEVVEALTDSAVAALSAAADGDLEASPLLSYSPSTPSTDEVDSLWVFAFGHRFAPGAAPPADGAVPPPDGLVPGPVNEELARLTATLVASYPVPVIAQWEVARVLDDLGVGGVISVEPDLAADGSVIYLSTAGVVAKGLHLAAAVGTTVGRAGILGHADHVVRCLLTARAEGLDAAVPTDLDPPTTYDPGSAQPWTRSRAAYIPVDLLGRTLLLR